MFEVFSVLALAASSALAVYAHMLRKQNEKMMSDIVNVLSGHNERLEYLFHKDSEFDKHIASVVSRFDELIARTSQEREGLSLNDIVGNLTAGAVQDSDFGDRR